jgi:hypothetical protein
MGTPEKTPIRRIIRRLTTWGMARSALRLVWVGWELAVSSFGGLFVLLSFWDGLLVLGWPSLAGWLFLFFLERCLGSKGMELRLGSEAISRSLKRRFEEIGKWEEGKKVLA